jgi:TolA-binding protein
MSGVALGLGITGIVMGAAGTAASFGQAGAQRRKRDAAQRAAERAFKDARKRLEVNYMEDLGINKGIYDIARDRSMVQAAGLMESAREGSARGIGSVAGQVYQQDLLGQQQVRAAQEQEMNRIEGLISGEDARLAGLQANLSLQEAEGAQRAAAEAENARRQAIGEGVQGAISTVGQAVSMAPLYGKGTAGQRKAGIESLGQDAVNSAMFGPSPASPQIMTDPLQSGPINPIDATLAPSDPQISLGSGIGGLSPQTGPLASSINQLNTPVSEMSKKDFRNLEKANPAAFKKLYASQGYQDYRDSNRIGQNFSSSPYIFNMGGVNAAQGSATGGTSPAIMEFLLAQYLESLKNQ